MNMKRILFLISIYLITACQNSTETSPNTQDWRVDLVTPAGIEVQINSRTQIVTVHQIDYAWEYVKNCTGLSAHTPFLVISDKNDDWTFEGHYYRTTGTVLVNAEIQYHLYWFVELLKHEFIHHLAFENGDLSGDDSELLACAET